MKRLGIVLAAIATLVGGERLYNKLSDGFESYKITSTLPFNPEYELDTPIPEEALSQKYSYLASGSQSFCFISSDEKYVIKFFKHARWRSRPYDIFFPKGYKKEILDKRTHSREATFESCLTAYRTFREETGLVYIHLNTTTHLNRRLKVRDNLGRKHRIDLDSTDFVVQRRAMPTPLKLLERKALGDHEGAKKAISDLFALIAYRRKLGYNDKDPNLIKNFGFLDGRPVEIDVGGFYLDPVKDYAYFSVFELPKIRRKMMPWISQNYPELIPHIDSELSALTLP